MMPLQKAIDTAKERGLDLVEVNPGAQPPVAKIAEWSKVLYREQKLERKKHLHKAGKVKGIRFTLVTFQHDLETKAKRTMEFLEKGYKVRIDIRLRRFEQSKKEETKAKVKNFLSLVTIPIAFDQKPLKTPMGYSFIIRKDTVHVKDQQISQQEVQNN